MLSSEEDEDLRTCYYGLTPTLIELICDTKSL